MKYVLDSSVALKWVLPEADSQKAIRLRDDFNLQINELLAPDVFPVEVAHALSRSERRGIIQPQEGMQKFADVLRTLPQLYPSLPLLPRAYLLSSQFRIGVYDCLYAVLAEQEQCQAVSADVRLASLFPQVVLLSSLP